MFYDARAQRQNWKQVQDFIALNKCSGKYNLITTLRDWSLCVALAPDLATKRVLVFVITQSPVQVIILGVSRFGCVPYYLLVSSAR
jgi:hypothetical protein